MNFSSKLKLTASGLLAAQLLACSAPPTVPNQSSANRQVSLLNRFGSRLTGQQLGNGHSLVQMPNGATYIANVPFASQGDDNTCGQAVMTMLMQYWGIDIDYQTVVNESNQLNVATSYEVVQRYLRSKGLQVQAYRDGNFETLLKLIHQGRPVMVLLDFGSLQQAHYVLVVGYNAKRNVMIIHESQSGPYMELDAEQFLEMWKNDPVVHLPLFGGSNYAYLLFDAQPESEASPTVNP